LKKQTTGGEELKRTDVNPNTSVITLDVNALRAVIKGQNFQRG
jgi:hypothetical protein